MSQYYNFLWTILLSIKVANCFQKTISIASNSRHLKELIYWIVLYYKALAQYTLTKTYKYCNDFYSKYREMDSQNTQNSSEEWLRIKIKTYIAFRPSVASSLTSSINSFNFTKTKHQNRLEKYFQELFYLQSWNSKMLNSSIEYFLTILNSFVQ